MRKIFLLLAMMGTVWAVDVKETKTSPVKTYTTFNERVADIAGAPYEPFYNNSILPVSGHLQVPATFKGQMLGSSKFTSANNSSADTLEFLGSGWKFSDGCFGDSLVVILPPGEVRPEWWGAKGDGATDNTVALNRALSTSLKVTLENGSIYGVSGKLYIPSNLYLDGNGAEIRCLSTFDSTNSQMVNNTNQLSDTGDSNIVIKNVVFNGSNLGYVGNNGVYLLMLRNIKNLKIEKCTFKNCTVDGIYLAQTFLRTGPGCRDVEISGCLFDNFGRNGISLIYGDQFKIHHNKFSNAKTGSDPGAGVDIEPNDSQIVNNCTVHHNYVTKVRKGLLAVAGADSSKIYNSDFSFNIIDSSTKTGIELWYTNDFKIIGNNIHSTTQSGILLERYNKRSQVTNNTIVNCGSTSSHRGIYLFQYNVGGIYTNNTVIRTDTPAVATYNIIEGGTANDSNSFMYNILNPHYGSNVNYAITLTGEHSRELFNAKSSQMLNKPNPLFTDKTWIGVDSVNGSQDKLAFSKYYTLHGSNKDAMILYNVYWNGTNWAFREDTTSAIVMTLSEDGIRAIGSTDATESKDALITRQDMFFASKDGQFGIGYGSKTAAMLAVNGGAHIGGSSNPGDDNLLVDGQIVLPDSTKNIKIKDGAGIYWRIKVSQTGVLSTDSTGQN